MQGVKTGCGDRNKNPIPISCALLLGSQGSNCMNNCVSVHSKLYEGLSSAGRDREQPSLWAGPGKRGDGASGVLEWELRWSFGAAISLLGDMGLVVCASSRVMCFKSYFRVFCGGKKGNEWPIC